MSTRAALQRVQLEPGHHVKLRPLCHCRETEAQRTQVTSPSCFTRIGLSWTKGRLMAPLQDSLLHVLDQSLWGSGMSWMVIRGGVENKMSSCGRSQLPAGQGSLPPTVQPTLCQGLLPAALRRPERPSSWGHHPLPSWPWHSVPHQWAWMPRPPSSREHQFCRPTWPALGSASGQTALLNGGTRPLGLPLAVIGLLATQAKDCPSAHHPSRASYLGWEVRSDWAF